MKTIISLSLLITFLFPLTCFSRTFSVGECIDGSNFILDTNKLKNDEDIPKQIFLEMFLPRIQDFSKEEQLFLLKYIDIVWDSNKTGNEIASMFLEECVSK
jgi:hypothetical protein